MKRSILLLAALSLLAISVVAQDQDLPEYGDSPELKDKQKVYVTTEDRAWNDSRAMIVAELKRYKGLQVVNSPDDADLFLVYSVKATTEERGRQPSHYMRSNLTAYALTEKHRKRILWSKDETYEES